MDVPLVWLALKSKTAPQWFKEVVTLAAQP